MDRIREARRTTMAANGLTRRRHRTNTLRDSPDEDGAMELQEPTRLRDRGSGKKDRDRERERERDRLGRTKRRRGDRLMHSSRDDAGDDTSEDSINDEEDDDDGDGGLAARDGGAAAPVSGSVRMLPLNPSSMSSSSSSLNHHRKSFPPAKVFRPTPPTTWKAADEMIGVSIPRKARSASTKRSHECWASTSAITAEQNHRQASTSPVRTAMAATAAPASPSSSNASARKKIKPNGGGPKFRPPKSSSKSSSSAQDDIEIEIAEVLYGMGRQSQGPSRNEIMALEASREANKSSSDGKSRISSPISNSQSALPQNSSSSATPVSAVAPKRKKPRPVKPEDENPSIFGPRSSPISSAMKPESEQPSKNETCSLNSEKNNTGSAPENLENQQPVGPMPEPIKPEGNVLSDSKLLVEEPEKPKDAVLSSKEVMAAPQSPKKESAALQQVDDNREDVKTTKANPTISEGENQREEKFQIDLMAPPPPLRSSPERDVMMNMVVDAEKEVKPAMKQDEKPVRMNKDEVAVGLEKERMRAMVEEAESNKAVIFQKERGIDLHLDLEKADKGDNGTLASKKQHQTVQRQQPQQTTSDKNVQSNSLPHPMSVPSWPGALPPMSYMTPLQGVVSMDGTTVTPAAMPPPHLLFNQPRPKRCATHCYIARTIMYHQQIARMNPFWPAAAGSASLYGAKPGHLNMVPSADLHGNVAGRAANPAQDKGHSLAMFPTHIGKDKAIPPAAADNPSRKQILLQQALPPGAAPSNILHGPAFIFPLNQQQAAAAASVRPGSVKSLPVTSNGASSAPSSSAPPNASATGVAAAPTMSFSYPNMPGNETQYLAILQNNAYPFPIPAHVGSPPAYRGTHAQAFPFFNGSFYSSQMLHPSQIQQQQQLPVQSQQNQQHGHQNTSMSSGSSSSQKHAQNQQQKPNAATGPSVGGGGSLQGFPVTKNLPSQPLQMQQQQPRQQLPNHHASHPARQIDSEMGGEDSPSTADSRIPRTTMNIYGQSFAMPMQTPNFALMTPASISGAGSNGSEKKQPQQQHPGSKSGAEASQAFAVSFAPINGATAGLDLSSIAQNHSIMQHHNYQLMAAAQAASAQNKKSYHVSEEGKSAGNSSNLDEDRKAMSNKIQASMGQSIAFSRPDVSDPSITSIAGSNVIDSSGRSLNLGSASSRASASVMPAAINSTGAASPSQQMQRCQQQILQLQKQSQFAAAASTRNKTPSTSNGIVYSDNLPSTSAMATKYPNAVSAFPQSLVQSSSTVAQSAQWKNSTRPTTSQSPPSMASTTPSSVKSLPLQQQGRSQQGHAQISFAANPKPSTTQVQPSSSTQSPSPPVMVGSPTTSSVSKNTGSPRTTSSSNNNKISQTSSLSSQQAKNSPAAPARKSSPVGGRNVPSILSGPQLTPSSTGSGSKSQLPQQQQKQQQQLPKQTMPQAQLFFSNPYMHSQVPQSGSSTPATSAAASGYYLQRRGPEQMQRPGSSGNSSNGATVNNSKGSTLPAQGLMHPAQFAAMPPSGSHHQFVPNFPYVHPVPAAVQVKPSDQKQPAGE
ncbi:hypothetical protein PIB30_015057 [Stylosanthes scabra]|uniref:Protein TIME FOR COFFEE n=1 Tax=Stylosanthes scabra TaxID=79078 RepID=A0ABU6Z3R0_9FABA|nr:hypothetical protein [Stylosanthes scabra]